ncbi:hypothetical protein Patl1_07809 [Pistacia atlantica]|uniref:Uncharacterized protein n=1 Tax=Pistacia atlantica TaxID=434234 RepID=A0ACC1AHX5_9ROSI|nr:hypothetical protein Patl1_07809 [Pistacia atlantica]
MSEVEEQVMSNNNVNVAYNKVDGVGVGVGGVALGSIEQQSHAGGGGVGNEGRMRHERGNGHNIVVGNAGGYGRGNMQGMGNRALSGPMWNRGPGAVGGRGMIGNGGNGFGQGIDGDPPLMHPHSIGFGPGFGAPMGRMGSYGGFLGAPSPPFSGESSSSTQLDVKRSGVHLVLPYVEEGEEINPSTNESSSFNFLDLDEFPQDFVRSDPFTPLDSDEFPQGCVRSHPFTPLDSDEFPQVPVASHTCTPLDSDEFPQGFVRSHPFTPLDSDEFPQVPVASDEDE